MRNISESILFKKKKIDYIAEKTKKKKTKLKTIDNIFIDILVFSTIKKKNTADSITLPVY